ncbi:MAG: Gfo/Idh/MocA family protein [Candidatus Thorarchaeota archaeon]
MNSKAGLRLGIIGIGKTGGIHLAALTAINNSGLLDFKITAICDTDTSKAKKVAEEFGISTVYENYEDLVNDDHVDVVYVCTPTNKHRDMVKAAARAKKAVFCEKPVAHSCPQVRELNSIAIDFSVKTSAGLNLRFDPFLLYAKNLIEKHDFGKPLLAHIRDDQQFPLYQEDYSQWRGENSVLGWGIILEECIHDIDILNWFFGDVVNVYAQVGFFTDRGIEDQASLVMKHKDGTSSTIDTIWHSVERPEERNIEFFFEKGYIRIVLESGNKYLDYQLQGEGPIRIHSENVENVLLDHLGISAKNKALEIREPLMDSNLNSYAALSYSFLKSIISNETLSPNFKDAVEAHKIVDAAYESAEKRCPIDIL